MNDEISVGDYIRTDDGYLAKVIEIESKALIFCDNFIRKNRFGEVTHIFIDDERITKHSPNIIELIEVGDLVEIEYLAPRYNERVTRLFEVEYTNIHIAFKNTHCELMYALDNKEWAFGDKKLKPIIKNIVTKEQFEKIMYRVEE